MLWQINAPPIVKLLYRLCNWNIFSYILRFESKLVEVWQGFFSGISYASCGVFYAELDVIEVYFRSISKAIIWVSDNPTRGQMKHNIQRINNIM